MKYPIEMKIGDMVVINGFWRAIVGKIVHLEFDTTTIYVDNGTYYEFSNRWPVIVN